MQNFRLNICGFELKKKIYRTLDTNFASYYIILDYQSVGKFTSKESNSHDISFLLNGHLKKRNIPLPTYLVDVSSLLPLCFWLVRTARLTDHMVKVNQMRSKRQACSPLKLIGQLATWQHVSKMAHENHWPICFGGEKAKVKQVQARLNLGVSQT